MASRTTYLLVALLFILSVFFVAEAQQLTARDIEILVEELGPNIIDDLDIDFDDGDEANVLFLKNLAKKAKKAAKKAADATKKAAEEAAKKAAEAAKKAAEAAKKAAEEAAKKAEEAAKKAAEKVEYLADKAADAATAIAIKLFDTSVCAINSVNLKREEENRDKIRSKYSLSKHDAAASFFASSVYNTHDDKKLPDFETLHIIKIETAKAGIFVNHKEKLVIVAVQGTDEDWISVNFKLALVSNPYGKGKVHHGFLTEVKQMVGDAKFYPIILDHLQKGYSVLTTGHSQGAAECSILAQAIVAKFPQYANAVRVVSMAAPRAGDSNWAKNFNVDAVRYVSGKDPVCEVPPREICFQHVGELRKLPCNQSGPSVFCHYPDFYFDGINNQLPPGEKYDQKGIEIVDKFNVDTSKRHDIAWHFEGYVDKLFSAPVWSDLLP